MNEDMLSVRDVAELTGLPDATIRTYKWRGSLPAPDGQFGRSPAWRRSTIEAWLRSRPNPVSPSEHQTEPISDVSAGQKGGGGGI